MDAAEQGEVDLFLDQSAYKTYKAYKESPSYLLSNVIKK